MEHAIRYHLREHLGADPEHYGRLSERLEEILTKLGEQWDQLALTLGDFLTEVRAGRQPDDNGLDPNTEAPFYDLLTRELIDEGRQVTGPVEELLRGLTVEVVHHIRTEIALVGFWHNTHAQNSLRGWVAASSPSPWSTATTCSTSSTPPRSPTGSSNSPRPTMPAW